MSGFTVALHGCYSVVCIHALLLALMDVTVLSVFMHYCKFSWMLQRCLYSCITASSHGCYSVVCIHALLLALMDVTVLSVFMHCY